jgi:hypothetical protein
VLGHRAGVAGARDVLLQRGAQRIQLVTIGEPVQFLLPPPRLVRVRRRLGVSGRERDTVTLHGPVIVRGIGEVFAQHAQRFADVPVPAQVRRQPDPRLGLGRMLQCSVQQPVHGRRVATFAGHQGAEGHRGETVCVTSRVQCIGDLSQPPRARTFSC